MIKLSKTQRNALEEALIGPLQKMRCGWSANGSRGFPLRTIRILDRQRLLTLRPHPDDSSRCRFHITDAGREALKQ